MKFKLTIRPAIPPQVRHKLEDVLEASGYHVWGGGQDTDGNESDITFDLITTELSEEEISIRLAKVMTKYGQ